MMTWDVCMAVVAPKVFDSRPKTRTVRLLCEAKAKAKAKDLASEAKAKAKDTISLPRESSRPRPRPRGLHLCNKHA